MKRSVIKRAVCLATAVMFLLVMCLSGCGADKEQQGAAQDTSAQTKAAEQSTTKEEAKLDFVKLKYYLPQPILDMSHKDSVMAEVNRMLKDKINAELEFIFIDTNQYHERMNIMSASGDPWDLALSGFTNNLTSNVSKGSCLAIDDLLSKYGQNILKLVSDRFWPAVTYGGKRYAVINVMPYVMAKGAVVQKELAEKYKLDTSKIKTLADLEPFLKTIKENEPGIIPLGAFATEQSPMLYNTIYDRLNTWLLYDTTDDKIKSILDAPWYVEQFRVLADYYKKGYIARDAALKKEANIENKTKKYAVMADPGSINDDGGVKATSFNGFPCVEINMGVMGMIGTSAVQTTLTLIGKKSKNPERAMMLLNEMFGDKKLFNTMCYGLEGQDYKVVSGAGTDNPTVEANAGDEQKWAIWHPWIGEMNYNQWPSNWNDEKTLETYRKGNENGKVSPILGFVFDPEPIKTEVGQIDAIIAEVLPILYTGSAPDVDKYIADAKARIEKAGFGNVLTEVEKQLADWRKANGK
jgi:putative aldouronate transport system substrate-binding protein